MFYKCPRSHIIEVNIQQHRMVYCGLCKKLYMKKGECERYQEHKGKLYNYTRYEEAKKPQSPSLKSHT
jgi:hypothetical protein